MTIKCNDLGLGPKAGKKNIYERYYWDNWQNLIINCEFRY